MSRLADMRLLRQLLAAAEAEACEALQSGHAAAIGAALGISKQAAAKRFGGGRAPSPKGLKAAQPANRLERGGRPVVGDDHTGRPDLLRLRPSDRQHERD